MRKIRFPALTFSEVLGSPQSYGHSPFKVFSASTSLSKVVLSREAKEDMFILPIECVSHLEIHGPNLNSWWFLKRAANLCQLRWLYAIGCDKEQTSANTIFLPNVRHFLVDSIPSVNVNSELTVLRFLQLEYVSGLTIKSFCIYPRFLTTNSLTTLCLNFAGTKHDEQGARFPDHIRELVTILPDVAPYLRRFRLFSDLHAMMMPTPAHERVYRGVAILIESMMDPNHQHFTKLEALSLWDISLPALHKILLRIVHERTTRNLYELDLIFPEDTPPNLLPQFEGSNGCCQQRGRSGSVN